MFGKILKCRRYQLEHLRSIQCCNWPYKCRICECKPNYSVAGSLWVRKLQEDFEEISCFLTTQNITYFSQLTILYEISAAVQISSKLEAAQEWNTFYLTHAILMKISKDIKFKCAKYKLIAELQTEYIWHRSNWCFSRKPNSVLKPVHVGFVVDKVTFGRVLHRTHPLSSGRAIPPMFHTDMSPQPTL